MALPSAIERQINALCVWPNVHDLKPPRLLAPNRPLTEEDSVKGQELWDRVKGVLGGVEKMLQEGKNEIMDALKEANLAPLLVDHGEGKWAITPGVSIVGENTILSTDVQLGPEGTPWPQKAMIGVNRAFFEKGNMLLSVTLNLKMEVIRVHILARTPDGTNELHIYAGILWTSTRGPTLAINGEQGLQMSPLGQPTGIPEGAQFYVGTKAEINSVQSGPPLLRQTTFEWKLRPFGNAWLVG